VYQPEAKRRSAKRGHAFCISQTGLPAPARTATRLVPQSQLLFAADERGFAQILIELIVDPCESAKSVASCGSSFTSPAPP
jgi:hypothetical protein